MKKLLFILAVVLCAAMNVNAEDKIFSIYGVSLGDSADQVIQNGLDRGYEVETALDQDKLQDKSLLEKIKTFDMIIKKQGYWVDWRKYYSDYAKIFGTIYNNLAQIPRTTLPYDPDNLVFVEKNPTIADTRMEYIIYRMKNSPTVYIYLYKFTGDDYFSVVYVNFDTYFNSGPTHNNATFLSSLSERYGDPKHVNNIYYWKNKTDYLLFIDKDSSAYAGLFNADKIAQIYEKIEAELLKKAREQKAQEEQKKQEKEEAQRKIDSGI